MPHVLAEALDESGQLAATDDRSRAEGLHRRALDVRVAHGLRTYLPDSLDALAGTAAGSSRPVRAARLLAAGTRAREEMGHPRPTVAVPDHDATLARLCSKLGEEGFASASVEGAAMSLDEAVAYAARTGTAPARPSSGWASLTPAELEVVRLAAAGHANPQIGTRLFMSRATVKSHLSHIYAKLGIANRTELASIAAARLDRVPGPDDT